jgi:hypothetical protein
MAKHSTAGKIVGRAAAGPLSLGILGASVLGALALASWPIAALGAAAYAALVASDMSSAEFRREVLFGKTPVRLPKPEAVTDPETRAQLAAIAAARAEIEKTVRATPPRIQRSIGTTVRSLDELEGHAAVLVGRAEELSAHLASLDLTELEREAKAHESRAVATHDAGARASYAAAADAANDRAQTVRDLAVARERSLAHLARIAATLKAVPAKLIKLRTLDDQASDALTGDVGAELDRMNTDLRAFEDTLAAIAEVHA